jgi:hypothetical protein
MLSDSGGCQSAFCGSAKSAGHARHCGAIAEGLGGGRGSPWGPGSEFEGWRRSGNVPKTTDAARE